MKRGAILAMMLLLPLLAGGCVGRAASEALGKVTGPKGMAIELSAPGMASLGSYRTFQIAHFQDDMGGRVPPELFADLPIWFVKALEASRLPNSPRGKVLLIRGQVIYYEDTNLGVNQIFGALEEVVARVQFVDKQSGDVLGEAICVGRTTTTTNRGAGKKAEGLAKAIVDVIDAHYPQAGRTRSKS